jgi:hypothetical protein
VCILTHILDITFNNIYTRKIILTQQVFVIYEIKENYFQNSFFLHTDYNFSNTQNIFIISKLQFVKLLKFDHVLKSLIWKQKNK